MKWQFHDWISIELKFCRRLCRPPKSTLVFPLQLDLLDVLIGRGRCCPHWGPR